MSDVVYATFSTWVTPTVQVEKGQIWDANDPVVRSHPDWFTADPSAFARKSVNEVFTAANATSESMSAAPGEKRSVKPAVDEAQSLRDALEQAGVKVDRRWGLEKLREEYQKVSK